jgi:hypothetical protein
VARYLPIVTHNMSNMYNLTQIDLLTVKNRNFRLLSVPVWLKNNAFIKCLWITTYHFIVAWQNKLPHRNYSTPAPYYPAAKLLDLLGFSPLHHISNVSLTNTDPIPKHHLHFPLLITIPNFIQPHIQHPAAPPPHPNLVFLFLLFPLPSPLSYHMISLLLLVFHVDER